MEIPSCCKLLTRSTFVCGSSHANGFSQPSKSNPQQFLPTTFPLFYATSTPTEDIVIKFTTSFFLNSVSSCSFSTVNRIFYKFCEKKITENSRIRDHFLKEPHHTGQKNHLFFIFEAKNVCLHFTPQAKVTDGC